MKHSVYSGYSSLSLVEDTSFKKQTSSKDTEGHMHALFFQEMFLLILLGLQRDLFCNQDTEVEVKWFPKYGTPVNNGDYPSLLYKREKCSTMAFTQGLSPDVCDLIVRSNEHS